MSGRWTHAVLAFVLALVVGSLVVPRGDARPDSARADALHVPRGSVHVAKRLEGPRVAGQPLRTLDLAPPPARFVLGRPVRHGTLIRSEPAISTPADPWARTPRARGPPA